MDTASELIELYTDEFQNEFSHFFEEITIFSKSKINEL
jgi:ribosomal protein S17E